VGTLTVVALSHKNQRKLKHKINIYDCKENSINNRLKIIIVLVPARVRYGHNLMSITHKTSGYITFTMKVAAMTLSPLTSSTFKQPNNHNMLDYTI
jgi:hypothetical protein